MENTERQMIERGMKDYGQFLLIAPGATRDTFKFFQKIYYRLLKKFNGSVEKAFYELTNLNF